MVWITVEVKKPNASSTEECPICDKKRKMVSSETGETCCRDCANWMDYKGKYAKDRPSLNS